MATSTYPIPGTNTDRILDCIKQNPGISVSGIVKGTGLNPSPVRTYIKNLLARDLIEDAVDEQGHHYTAKGHRL